MKLRVTNKMNMIQIKRTVHRLLPVVLLVIRTHTETDTRTVGLMTWILLTIILKLVMISLTLRRHCQGMVTGDHAGNF